MILLQTGDIPTPDELEILKSPTGSHVSIIQTVSTDWIRIGTLMKFDGELRTMDAIEANHPHDVYGCVRELFKRWLRNEAQVDPSWKNLITLLKDCELASCAELVEKILHDRKRL